MDLAQAVGKTRKLMASYSVHTSTAMNATHGMSAEQELLNSLQDEIAKEIDMEIIGKLRAMGKDYIYLMKRLKEFLDSHALTGLCKDRFTKEIGGKHRKRITKIVNNLSKGLQADLVQQHPIFKQFIKGSTPLIDLMDV